jgi:hypothetical protein
LTYYGGGGGGGIYSYNGSPYIGALQGLGGIGGGGNGSGNFSTAGANGTANTGGGGGGGTTNDPSPRTPGGTNGGAGGSGIVVLRCSSAYEIAEPSGLNYSSSLSGGNRTYSFYSGTANVTFQSATADPYFSNVSLLLHMDGANGSTTFTDNSASARTVTAVGNAQISTTQSQFGGAAAYFDGTGDYLSLSGGMPSGTGTAFTIECWIRLDDLSAYRSITRTNGGLDIGVQPNGLINCDQTSVGIIANSATGVITAGTWYHIAVTRDTSNSYKIYVNGTQVASATNAFSVTAATTIGYSAYSGSHYFKGYIDDFRVTNALRYVSNFTPPASAFPNA